ncbi:MAG TPA: tetratricopeptide repeat protein [Candidatus Obscuribacterales bacterium]
MLKTKNSRVRRLLVPILAYLLCAQTTVLAAKAETLADQSSSSHSSASANAGRNARTNLLAANPGTSTTAATADPSAAEQLLSTLRAALKTKKISIKVVGDGVTTTKVRLLLTNNTNKPVKVVIPANEMFHPNVGSVQTMMAIKDVVVTVPVGETAAADLDTVCASAKTIAPPPADGVNFEVKNYDDVDMWKKLAQIVAAAEELENVGAFAKVPMSGNRKQRITQLAIWKLLGDKSVKPEDKVTPDSIELDLLKAVGEQVKVNPDLLGKLPGYALTKEGNLIVTDRNRKKALDDQVALIFGAVDLTINRSQAPDLKGVASVPSHDTLRGTYCDVGERAFEKGDYTEAETLLTEALKEAEAYGEADPWLNKALFALGRFYVDYGWKEKAETLLKRALLLREKIFGKDSLQVAEVDNELGVLEQIKERYDAAGEFFRKALAIYEKSAGAASESVAKTLNYVGRNLSLEGKAEEAKSVLMRALAVAMGLNVEREKTLGGLPSLASTADVGEIEANLATVYRQLGDLAQADKYYQNALNTQKKALGDEHPFVARILDGWSKVCREQNRNDEALAYANQAKSIGAKTLGDAEKDIADLPLGHEPLTRIYRFNKQQGERKKTAIEFLKAGEGQKIDATMDKSRINRPIKDKWALVIGISKFQDPTINLRYAAKDAQDFAEFLKKEGNFAPDHVRVLLDEKATKERIMAEIGDKWLPRVADRDDLVLIYISSHGSPSKVDLNGINYLVAHNTNKNSLYATGIPIQQLATAIKERVKCDRVVLLMDACHSGAANPAGKGLFRISNYSASEMAQGCGQLVICSSEPTQTSWESKRYPNGVFTHYLLEALRKDGSKTKLGDAFSYLQSKVREEVRLDRNGEEQSPVLKSKWEGSDLVLAVSPTEKRQSIPEDDSLDLKVKATDATSSGAGKAPIIKGGAKATAVAKTSTAKPAPVKRK